MRERDAIFTLERHVADALWRGGAQCFKYTFDVSLILRGPFRLDLVLNHHLFHGMRLLLTLDLPVRPVRLYDDTRAPKDAVRTVTQRLQGQRLDDNHCRWQALP